MLQCLSLKSSSATSSQPTSPYPPHLSRASSIDGTPRSSTVHREYRSVLQSDSFNEMRNRVQLLNNNQDQDQGQEVVAVNELSQVLNPNRQHVEEALRHARPNTLTPVVSAFFEHSESTTNLYVSLNQSISLARGIYAPIHQLLENLPDHDDSDTLTQFQCDMAFDVFHQFNRLDNPFPPPDSPHFNEMRCCFTQLNQQLDNSVPKSQSQFRVKLCQRGKKPSSALCLIGTTAAAVVISAAAIAVAIATHTLVAAVVACPFCTAYFRSGFSKKVVVAHMAQHTAAKIGTFVLNGELDTIDRLVAQLHNAIEDDKSLIQLGLERSRDMYPIQQVVKLLRKSHVKLNSELDHLEQRICLCFKTVNSTRSRLLQEIHLQSLLNSEYLSD